MPHPKEVQSDLFGGFPASENKLPEAGKERGVNFPASVGRPIVSGERGKPSPLFPLSGERASSPLTSGRPSAASGEEEKNLKEAKTGTQDALASWSLIVADYDKALTPYWSQKDKIFNRLVNTHGETVSGDDRWMLVYNRAGKDKRAGLFLEADALAIEYGQTLKERREAALEARLLQKEIEHINKRLDQLAKRKKK